MTRGECQKCKTPFFDLPSQCPYCGTPVQARTYSDTVRLRQILLLLLLGAIAIATKPTEQSVRTPETIRYADLRLYKGAKLYDRLTGDYAGEVVGWRTGSPTAAGDSPELVGLRSPAGQTEWKARETVNRFFTTHSKP